MALIKCPECGKEISDKAEVCIHCGYPIKKYENQNLHTEENIIIINGVAVNMEKIMKDNKPESIKLLREATGCDLKTAKNIVEKYFKGVYRKTVFGRKMEVYCPKCKTSDCSQFYERSYTQEEIKVTHTLNLNPLKPFTIFNSKEKVVRPSKEVQKIKFRCNKCGYIFD